MHWLRNRATRTAFVALSAFVLRAPDGAATAATRAAEMPVGQTVDGIRCDRAEGAVLHIHQHLTIVHAGAAVVVPGDVGRPVFAACLYWLHTHATDGIIHVESPVARSFTLGNFFDVWGEPLSPTQVLEYKVAPGRLRAYVDGRQYRGDPRRIPLADHADITLEVGPPFRKPQPFGGWNGQ